MSKSADIGMIAVIAFIAIAFVVIIGIQFNNADLLPITVNSVDALIVDSANDTTKDSIILANMASHKNMSYSLPNTPTYILRLDDVQSPAWSDISMKIISDTISRNMSICIGVIPDRDDPNNGMVAFINKNKDNQRLEIAQHGYKHSYCEYDNMSEDQARQKTMNGLRKLYSDYNMCPVTFIPPNNEISSRNNSTMNVLNDIGFKVVSSDGDVHYEGNILNAACDAATRWGDEKELKQPNEIIYACEEDFKDQNLSVIMIHPQYYAAKDGKTLDPVKYATYLELLDKLNATGAQSITFRDLLVENKPE
jgi:hypothetical protein